MTKPRAIIVDTNPKMTKGEIRDARTGQVLNGAIYVDTTESESDSTLSHFDGRTEPVSITWNIVAMPPEKKLFVTIIGKYAPGLYTKWEGRRMVND